MNNVTIIKPLSEITNRNIPSNMSTGEKIDLVFSNLDSAKYDFLGFVNRTNNMVLAPRYHIIRNERGRFAKAKRS